MVFPIVAKADSTYGYPDITFPNTYHITGNLYRSYKANGALMTTSSFPLSKDGEYAYQIYYSVEALTGPVTIYLADTSGNNVLTLYSSGGAGGSEIARSDTVAIPASLIGKTVTFNVKETYAASYWTDYNHDIYIPTVYYKTKPTGASIPSSGRIPMSGTYSANTGQVRAGYNRFDKVPGQGSANSATTSTIPYDLSSVKKISYSEVTTSTYASSSSYDNRSESRTMSFYEALSGEKLFDVTLNNGSGEVDMEGYNQIYDLSNTIIKMQAYASVYVGSGAAGKSGVYAIGSSSLPQYIEVEDYIPVFSADIPTAKTYNYEDSLSFTVAAGGKEPLSYQWYKNDVAITGATSNTLDLGVQKTYQTMAFLSTVSYPMTLVLRRPKPAYLAQMWALSSP